ncbi:MAG: hypothetical protein QOJ15_9705 [Bradyrhizobium sp.]|nr:hypothetical protein [Bradyrhizobium sp.]
MPRNRTCREVAGIRHPSSPVLRAPPLRHRSSDSVEIAGDQPFDAPVDEHRRDHRRPRVEKTTLRPGPNRGEIDATLHGELGTILSWIEAQAVEKTRKRETPAAFAAECRYRRLRGHATISNCYSKQQLEQPPNVGGRLYSAWKSANFRNVFKSRSDISQLFWRLRSLQNFSLSEWRVASPMRILF